MPTAAPIVIAPAEAGSTRPGDVGSGGDSPRVFEVEFEVGPVVGIGLETDLESIDQ